MSTTLKSFNKFSYHIINSLQYDFNNGVIEGVNNLINVSKGLLLDIVVSIILKLELCLLLAFINIIKKGQIF